MGVTSGQKCLKDHINVINIIVKNSDKDDIGGFVLHFFC
uniref:Uncharacterized protein n=1 Tax=Anguilla anguilla TaxID=7936 RepID=A0A0E9TM75_ANGAN